MGGRGIPEPSEQELPPGLHRDLVLAVRALYRAAGFPSVRTIADGIKDGDEEFPDLMNHQLVAEFLRGRTLSTLPKVQSLAMYLAVQQTPRRDRDETRTHITALWDQAFSAKIGYYSRLETSKTQLSDNEVERPILQRGLTDQHLASAMAQTVVADPEPQAENPHFYFTAVPTQAPAGMLLDYTRDRTTQFRFINDAPNLWGRQFAAQDTGTSRDPRLEVVFASMLESYRSMNPRGAWFQNHNTGPEHGLGISRRRVGLDDDGTIRFIDLAAGSMPNGVHPAAAELRGLAPTAGTLYNSAEVYHTPICWYTLDMVRLVNGLAQTHDYDGGWLFGVSLGNLKGWSESRSIGPLPDDGQLSATCRATAAEIADKPRWVAAELLRPLMRDLSAEALLDQLASPTK